VASSENQFRFTSKESFLIKIFTYLSFSSQEKSAAVFVAAQVSPAMGGEGRCQGAEMLAT
jgi:hypothetical protein